MQKGRRDAHKKASVDVMCHYRWFFFFFLEVPRVSHQTLVSVAGFLHSGCTGFIWAAKWVGNGTEWHMEISNHRPGPADAWARPLALPSLCQPRLSQIHTHWHNVSPFLFPHTHTHIYAQPYKLTCGKLLVISHFSTKLCCLSKWWVFSGCLTFWPLEVQQVMNSPGQIVDNLNINYWLKKSV